MTLDEALPLIGLTPLPAGFFAPAAPTGRLSGIGIAPITRTIWTLTISDNGGTTTEVYTDRADLDARALAWVKEAWTFHGDGKRMPATWQAAMEHLSENATSFYDWIGSADEHEVTL